MEYKTELHCHSKDASGCASESAEGIVEKYLKYGYSTVVLTNHFVCPSPERWHEEVEKHYNAYDKLVKAADGKLNILMGMEFRCSDLNNDYLGFGFDRDYIENFDPALMSNIEYFSKKFMEDGNLLIWAHPFRWMMTMIRPWCYEGVEVFNGHMGHTDSKNFLARCLAEHFGKIMTSGSDYHDSDQMPSGGIITNEPVTSEKQLVETLRSRKYKLITKDDPE